MTAIYNIGIGRGGRPVVNFGLIAISVVVFIYELSLGGLDRDIFFFKYGLIPVELTEGIEFKTLRGPSGPDIESPIPTWGTVFTSMFIHVSVLHILGNMLFLYGFGDKVENKLGHVKYLLFYLATGVAATWTQVATDMDSQAVIIGASGAISGVVGAYLLAFPYDRSIPLLFVFLLLPLLLDVGSLGVGLPGTGIAYMAHVGGFVAGVLLMAGYKFLLREPILPRGSLPWRMWRDFRGRP